MRCSQIPEEPLRQEVSVFLSYAPLSDAVELSHKVRYNRGMRRFFTQLARTRRVSSTYTELTFAWPDGLRRPLPGQFLTIRVHQGYDPFLRRPFSLSGWHEATRQASVLIQERGPGSAALCALGTGAELDLLGPRGFPFPYQFGQNDKRPYLLLGGGIGTGPMLFAAQYLAEKGEPLHLCLGFRDKAMIPVWEWPAEYQVRLAAEKGGGPGIHEGRVLDLADSAATQVHFRAVWACGPHPMLHAVYLWTKARGLPCYVLVEERMACGVGACMGCALPVTDGRGFLRSCTEGPVFDGAVIDWEAAWT